MSAVCVLQTNNTHTVWKSQTNHTREKSTKNKQDEEKKTPLGCPAVSIKRVDK
jgi:hypothetical protein